MSTRSFISFCASRSLSTPTPTPSSPLPPATVSHIYLFHLVLIVIYTLLLLSVIRYVWLIYLMFVSVCTRFSLFRILLCDSWFALGIYNKNDKKSINRVWGREWERERCTQPRSVCAIRIYCLRPLMNDILVSHSILNCLWARI